MDKKQLVSKIIKQSGVLASTSRFFHQMLTAIDVTGNVTAEKALNNIKERFDKELEDVVINIYYPKYDEHFIDTELIAISETFDDPIAVKSRKFNQDTQAEVEKEMTVWFESLFTEFQKLEF